MAGARLTDGELALDALVVQECERPPHGLGGGRVAEAMGHAQPPVPVVLRVRHGVDLNEQRGGLDIAPLVEDPQVELELGPVGRHGVHHRLEVVGERHRGED